MELVQKGGFEFVFAGENGSVLASPEITKEIYKIDQDDQLWNNLQKNKVTNFGGVPYIYSILEKIDFKNF